MPVEAGLELGAIVRLDDQHPKGQPPEDLVHITDGGCLVAGVVHLKDPYASAVIDRGKLI